MPLIKIHVIEDAYGDGELDLILETVHRAMVESFNVPERDRYQILTQHRSAYLIAQDTGLGFERSARFVLIEAVSRQRRTDQKTAFYEAVCAGLGKSVSLAPTDLMMSFQINGDEDWSFGCGEAQFLTGAL